jgi:hypothetical protein
MLAIPGAMRFEFNFFKRLMSSFFSVYQSPFLLPVFIGFCLFGLMIFGINVHSLEPHAQEIL